MYGASCAIAQPVDSDAMMDSDLLSFGYDVPVAMPVASGDGGVTH
jgi:hypothetical protein